MYMYNINVIIVIIVYLEVRTYTSVSSGTSDLCEELDLICIPVCDSGRFRHLIE